MPNNINLTQCSRLLPFAFQTYMQTLSFTTANHRYRVKVVPTSTTTIESVAFRLSGVTGTLTEMALELWERSDSNPTIPGTLLETVAKTTGLPTGAGLVTFTGFTTTLTARKRYYFVLRNNTPTPSSNYFSIQTTANSIGFITSEQCNSSTDGGTTWSNTGFNCFIKLTNGDRYESAITSTTAPTGITNTSGYGLELQAPNTGIRLYGVYVATFNYNETGTPYVWYRIVIYVNKNEVYNIEIPNKYYSLEETIMFDKVVDVPPNATYQMAVFTVNCTSGSVRIYGYELDDAQKKIYDTLGVRGFTVSSTTKAFTYTNFMVAMIPIVHYANLTPPPELNRRSYIGR